MLADTKSAQYSKVLGNWNIYKRIGHGTNGKTVVYQIVRRNSTWEESCALKAVPLICENGVYSQFTEERRREYLKSLALRKEKAVREVQYMSALRGKTNIVDYIDYDTVEWKESDSFGCDLLIRMELLHNLRDELRNGRIFSEKEIIKIGRDICSALIVCHEKNILHRDIKPENIFFNDDGDYKLGDFGIARILDQCQDSASTGIGTPEYAAPEQSSGKYDMRVDIYSLGLVLYELSNRNYLTFAQSTYLPGDELQARLLGKPLPAPCNASLTLSDIILKACSYNPSERYQSAQELSNALEKITLSQSPCHVEHGAFKKTIKNNNPAKFSEYQTVPATPNIEDSNNIKDNPDDLKYKNRPRTRRRRKQRLDMLLDTLIPIAGVFLGVTLWSQNVAILICMIITGIIGIMSACFVLADKSFFSGSKTAGVKVVFTLACGGLGVPLITLIVINLFKVIYR